MFDSARSFVGGQVWRLATYAFVHAPVELLWFAVEMYMLFVFGREVERFIGQRAYIAFIHRAAARTDGLPDRLGFWQRRAGRLARVALWSFCGLRDNLSAGRIVPPDYGQMGRADSRCHLHPAAARLSRMDRSGRRLDQHWRCVSVCGAARRRARAALAGYNFKTSSRPKPKLYVVQNPSARRVVEPDDVYASVDPILDKISKSGIGSLTASERRPLDRARNRLLKNQSDGAASIVSINSPDVFGVKQQRPERVVFRHRASAPTQTR